MLQLKAEAAETVLSEAGKATVVVSIVWHLTHGSVLTKWMTG